ncbi:hypothetical protein KKC60_01630, partial [Patescibacteria group bacterium]|nr:hypothetical protein [Patescibacteria group bacterium]
IKSSEGDEEKLLGLEEEVPILKVELEDELKRLKVYEVVFDNMNTAKNKVSFSAKGRLEQDINKYLPFITDNKYEKVYVNDDLAFEVFSKEAAGRIKPEDHLSRGTVDQFYLAARFSLVKLMSEEKKPPMILDDPLVTFDKVRTKKAMELIKKFSEEFQIFLFTYDDVYDKWGDKVIEI